MINIIYTTTFAAVLFTAAVFAPSSVARPAMEKPNIILIMADIVSWEAFGCYGAKETTNVAKEHPEIVKRMAQTLLNYKEINHRRSNVSASRTPETK